MPRYKYSTTNTLPFPGTHETVHRVPLLLMITNVRDVEGGIHTCCVHAVVDTLTIHVVVSHWKR